MLFIVLLMMSRKPPSQLCLTVSIWFLPRVTALLALIGELQYFQSPHWQIYFRCFNCCCSSRGSSRTIAEFGVLSDLEHTCSGHQPLFLLAFILYGMSARKDLPCLISLRQSIIVLHAQIFSIGFQGDVHYTFEPLSVTHEGRLNGHVNWFPNLLKQVV